MRKSEEYINELLAKYMAGETISEKEKRDVSEWIVSHPDEYAGLLKLNSHDIPTFNVKNAWYKVEKIIDGNSAVRKNRHSRKISMMPVFYAAASIAVIIVICLSFFLANSDEQSFVYANENHINKSILLPDSTIVILYPDAKLSYESARNSIVREVKLSGKAFFNVKKIEGKSFKVYAENVMVQVLGTSFLVDVTKSDSSAVYVKTGIVKVEAVNSNVIIRANQKAELTDNVLKTGIIDNPMEVFGDKPAELVFKEESISVVALKIEKVTGVKIEVDKKLENNTITSKINLDDIDAVMEELAFLCRCKCEVVEEGKHYRLY